MIFAKFFEEGARVDIWERSFGLELQNVVP